MERSKKKASVWLCIAIALMLVMICPRFMVQEQC